MCTGTKIFSVLVCRFNMADPVAIRNFLALKKKSYAVKFDLDGTGYSPVENIGAGAYGVVCSAIQKKTNKLMLNNNRISK